MEEKKQERELQISAQRTRFGNARTSNERKTQREHDNTAQKEEQEEAEQQLHQMRSNSKRAIKRIMVREANAIGKGNWQKKAIIRVK